MADPPNLVEKAIPNSFGYDVYGGCHQLTEGKCQGSLAVWRWRGLWICQLYDPLNAHCYHLCIFFCIYIYLFWTWQELSWETSKLGDMATELPSKICLSSNYPCVLPSGASQDSHSTSFPRFAKLWLAFVGLLDFPQSCGPFSRPGFCLFISSLLLVILVASVISLTSAGVSDPYISATTLCYLLGVLAAAWRLRWSGVQDLLSKRDNGGLEAQIRG